MVPPALFSFCFCATMIGATSLGQADLVLKGVPKRLFAEYNEQLNLKWIIEKSTVKRILKYELSDGASRPLAFNQSVRTSMEKITVADKHDHVSVSFKLKYKESSNFTLCVYFLGYTSNIKQFSCDIIMVLIEKPIIVPSSNQKFSFEEGSAPTLSVTLGYSKNKTLTPKWAFAFYPQKTSSEIYYAQKKYNHSLAFKLPQLDRSMCGEWFVLDVYFNERVLATWKKKIDVKFIPPMVTDVVFTKDSNCYTVSWCPVHTRSCVLQYSVEFLNRVGEVMDTLTKSGDDKQPTSIELCDFDKEEISTVVVWATKNDRHGAKSPPKSLSRHETKQPCLKEDVTRIKTVHFNLLIAGCSLGCLAVVIAISYCSYCLCRKVIKTKRRRKQRSKSVYSAESITEQPRQPLYEPVGSIFDYTEPPKQTGMYNSIIPVFPAAYQALQKETIYLQPER